MAKVYDEEKQASKPGEYDDLGVDSKQRAAEVAALNKQFAAPDAVKTKDIKNAEQSADAGSDVSNTEQSEIDKLSKGYREENERFAKSKNLLRRVTGSKRRNLIGGGVLGGGLIGLLVMLFIALPLKVQHIVNNLQNTFFAAAEQATEDMTDNFFRHYVVKQLVPGMVENNCTSTRINRSCVNTSTSSTIVGVLYNGWRDGRLEQRMADNGIEIRKEGRSFYLKTPTTTAQGEFLGDFDSSNPNSFQNSAFQKLNRNDLRKEVKKALKEDTKWDRVFYRFKVGRYMERKFGVKRCIIACTPRDRFTDSIEDKKLAFKAYFLERVIEPRNEMMGLVLQCAISEFSCVDERDSNERGERLSQFELDVQAKLADFRSRHGERKVSELRSEADRVRQMGAIEYMVEKLAGPLATQTASKAIPIIGWVDLAATVISSAKSIGPAITKMTYVTNAATMASTYAMYRTNADEIKTGEVDINAVGSVATSLSPTDGVERKDQNGVGAEGSPLWGGVMGSSGRSVAFNPFSQKVYAAASYGCEDDSGNPPPAGELVCGVERLDSKTAVGDIADYISRVMNSPAAVGGSIFASIWNNTGGRILDLADAVLGRIIEGAIALIPGDPVAKIMELVQPLIDSMMKFVIKPVLSNDASGARMFNMAAGGADVIANDFAHYNLGGAKISDADAFAIRQEREQERLDEFSNRSMFARMFSTDTPYSMTSQFALASSAGNSTGLIQTMFSTMSNPFGTISSSLFGFGLGGNASAANTLTKDPFGVTQFGYPENDKVFTQDPEQTWEEEDCDNPEQIKTWGNRAVNNDVNEMPEHPAGDVNRCLLISSAAGSAGAMFTDEVLPAEELGETSTETPVNPGGTNIRVASFNIFHSDDEPENVWKARLRRSVDTLINNQIDIAGLQEVRPNQISAFNTSEFGGDVYDMFPTALQNPGFSPNPIIWNKSKFRKVSDTSVGFTYFDGVRDRAPVVKLEQLVNGQPSGQMLYIINTHDPADTRGEADFTRFSNATNDYKPYLENLYTEGLPIFFTGDFNSGYSLRQGNNNTYQNVRENLTYCILTRSGNFWDAYDAAIPKNGECPTSTGINDVDHIFISKNVTVTNYSTVAAGTRSGNGSDTHRTIMADVTLGTAVGGDGFAWPIAASDHVRLSNCYEKPGHTGIDIPIQNKTVYAAASGKVALTGGPSGDAGNYIMINHGNGYWSNYQHLSSKAVGVGQQVTQGQAIGVSGNTGYVVGSNGGYHLHFGITNREGLDSRRVVAYSLNPLGFLPNDGRDLGGCTR